MQAATCTEPSKCKLCGITEDDPKGHDWKAATCDKPETCADCGETRGEALGHKPGEGSCDEAPTCSVCNKKVGDPLGHKWLDATTDAPKTCERCGKTEGDKLKIDSRFQTSKCQALFGNWEGKLSTNFQGVQLEGMLYVSFTNDGHMTIKLDLEDYDACFKAAVQYLGDKNMAKNLFMVMVDPYINGKTSVYYVDNGILYSAEHWEVLDEDWAADPFNMNAAGTEASMVVYMGQSVTVQKVG
jgi:hypothetical protein